jgi:hypothetical protein
VAEAAGTDVAAAAGFDAPEGGATDAAIAGAAAVDLATDAGAAGGMGAGSTTAMVGAAVLEGISIPTSNRPEPRGRVGEIATAAVSEELPLTGGGAVTTGSVTGGNGMAIDAAEVAAERPRAMRYESMS